jgi:hypothetical protein
MLTEVAEHQHISRLDLLRMLIVREHRAIKSTEVADATLP